MIGLAGASVSPLVARAQQPGRMRLIGILTNVVESDLDEQERVAAFREALLLHGWTGNGIQFAYRWTAGNEDLVRTYARDIVGMKPEVIFVVGTSTVSAVLQHTRSIPVVFVTGADPVKVGFAESLARPGGNATGFAEFEVVMGAKWLQLLREIAPTVTRIVILHSNNPPALMQLPELQRAASGVGIQILEASVRSAAEIERALNAYAGETGLGLIATPSGYLAVHRKLIIALAAQHRFPAVYPNRRYPADGGLMSYGVDRVEQYRRAGSYVDQILKGAKPGDLPVQNQEKFEFVLNMKTAKALGLDVPRIVLARAHKVIE